MNAAKKGIILFLWLVVMTVATATASIPHTSENRVWGKIASGAELRPFTALQVAELQWDEKPFRLKLALDQTYPVNGLDPDGRCIEGASAAFAGAPSPGNSSGAFDAGYSGEMETAAATSSIAGSLLSLVSPNTDMNGAAQFASSVGTVYNDSRTTGDSILGATLLATGYGLTSWNIGSIYQGVYNVNVLTSQPLGGWAEQTQSIVSGIGGTAGVAAGGLGLYNGISVGAATTAAESAEAIKPGSFSVYDWTGYPSYLPKPTGPMNLVEGADYTAARSAANAANNGLREGFGLRGEDMDIHEIQPVKFGGSPTDSVEQNASTQRSSPAGCYTILEPVAE